jgi:hypothetical protein
LSCPYGGDLDDVDDRSIEGSVDEELFAERFCKCDIPNICKNPSWLEPETSRCFFKRVDQSDPVTFILLEVFKVNDSKLSPNIEVESPPTKSSLHHQNLL